VAFLLMDIEWQAAGGRSELWDRRQQLQEKSDGGTGDRPRS